MRNASDRLCREYGLSVIDNSKEPDITKTYIEWKSEKDGGRTWRTAIREDVDKAINKSISFNAFIRNLRSIGYEVKTGVKHIAVKPLGKERFVRLRSLGEEYTEDKIRERILRQRLPDRNVSKPKIAKARYIGTFHLTKRITWNSIRGLYYYFLNLLKKSKENNEGLYLIRDELRHLDKLSEHAKFLNTHNIDTEDELKAYKEERIEIILELESQRKTLRNKMRKVNISDEDKFNHSSEVKRISARLKDLRKEVNLCEVIEERSKDLKIKKEIIREEKVKSLHPDSLSNKRQKNIKR